MTWLKQDAMGRRRPPSVAVGLISDHFRLPWRFHARIVAARGAAAL
ncbi:hypothetical protein [Bauldia sp.]